ncbi:MAG: M3 family oligoendopeptidase [Pseudohongiellaceae bacterium]|jgi:M3 family oligoendopeptidase
MRYRPAMSTSIFADIAASQPDLDELARRNDELLGALAAATDEATGVEQCVALILGWDATRREFETWSNLVDLRFNQDTTDATAIANRQLSDELGPQWIELEVAVKQALREHPLHAQLKAALGEQVFSLWEVDVLAFDPAIKDGLVQESKLEGEYTSLLASAKLRFQDEDLNLSTLVKYRVHSDRQTRHGAEQVHWQWFAENGDQLDRIYDDMVALRTKMARQLGYDSFIELAYKRMFRIDYNRDDVDRFRAQVREHVVPLATRLAKEKAETLGLDELMAWDEPVCDLQGNPVPQGDHDWMMARAKEMFDEMGSGLGEFFRLMASGGFLDLRSREGKAGGGFCTNFPNHGMPFVYANFNGTKGDVEVFTHEVGHAFQNYSSSDQKIVDTIWPTMESCEVHSMSLEFLTWPHMEKFFGDDAERFRQVHLAQSLTFLPYGTAVDHFQHEVYSRPEATPAERHEMWREMERIYLPWRQWGDMDYAAKGGRWQAQQHIYGSPFYYIDYVLAQTCALQFLRRSRADEAEAMSAYVALCRRGGEAPFQELVRSAGLVSPFDEGCLAAVVDEAQKLLGL